MELRQKVATGHGKIGVRTTRNSWLFELGGMLMYRFNDERLDQCREFNDNFRAQKEQKGKKQKRYAH